MAKIYYERDADPTLILQKKVAIIGFGSQGHAHALNLRDSGVDVRVGLRRGSKSWQKAEEQGLPVREVAEAAQEADVIMLLLPDTEQPKVYEQSIAPYLNNGKT
ncbi:MAG: NAD(P)-binding domain-containing protein, partial [Anaerolineales bacterium]|nr:NAD(P)-binding domain-containing protein [Anaerolineales bacterium]MDW8447607.1 NAD(P)-binding domain-containing protein [Anaerolineales bacterium]